MRWEGAEKMSYETNLQIGVKASCEDVYKTLTETERLAQWWIALRGSGNQVGDRLEYQCPGGPSQRFEVRDLVPGELVVWNSPKGQGANEWEGTEITFRISRDEQQTYIRFRHSGWEKNSDFHALCSMKWATFMLSLKDLVEQGKGRPSPNDLQINYH
jgi:uncharacterized protein YndB with AHSA1/START domain